MGRKTWDSLGAPLKDRFNIVISRDTEFLAKMRTNRNVEVVSSLEAALESAYMSDYAPYVIGGGQIYAEALPYVSTMYLTRFVDYSTVFDTFFPHIDWNNWVLRNEVDPPYSHIRFQEYERKIWR
jgi:dihydrofolate reductase